MKRCFSRAVPWRPVRRKLRGPRCGRHSGASPAGGRADPVPRLRGVNADASDGGRTRAVETRGVPPLVRLLRDRVAATHLRTAAVLTGGAVGALARAGVGRAFPVQPGQWPWA